MIWLQTQFRHIESPWAPCELLLQKKKKEKQTRSLFFSFDADGGSVLSVFQLLSNHMLNSGSPRLSWEFKRLSIIRQTCDVGLCCTQVFSLLCCRLVTSFISDIISPWTWPHRRSFRLLFYSIQMQFGLWVVMASPQKQMLKHWDFTCTVLCRFSCPAEHFHGRLSRTSQRFLWI